MRALDDDLHGSAGNISEVITAVAGQKIALKTRMRELQEYIVARKLPKEISMQVIRVNRDPKPTQIMTLVPAQIYDLHCPTMENTQNLPRI